MSDYSKALLIYGLTLTYWFHLDAQPDPCDFPAIYNFGDSYSDTGALSSVFWRPILPSGETFFKKPTGRASDGRLVIDFIAERLGLPFLSPYLESVGSNFSHGANFATGGSTIRRWDEKTAPQNWISPFSLDIQITQYELLESKTKDLYKQEAKDSPDTILPRPKDFSKALYTFDIGINDLSVGYGKLGDRQLRAAIPGIIAEYSTAVKNLYRRGARSFWVHNTVPYGCLPAVVMSLKDPHLDPYGCVKDRNDMAMEFNQQLKDALVKLRRRLPKAAITHVDLYAAIYELVGTFKSQGFGDPFKICCGYHEKDGDIGCGQTGRTSNGTRVFGGSCEHPESYISWDGVHRTEAANHWIAKRILSGSLSDPPLSINRACYRA